MAEKRLCEELEPLFCKILTYDALLGALQGGGGGMGNPTSRQLQTLQPLSTFEFCPSGTDHDESVNDHALLTPLTLQIIMAIMVTHCALQVLQSIWSCPDFHR